MLFVFQVDTGRMMTFDMSLALESVQNLKIHVESAFKIPVDKQVLLISGGEHLRPDDRVCSYPAGTDTNPIFLFSKYLIERDQPPAASVDYGSEHDFTAKVKESSDLPPTYNTVQRRAQLARQFCESSQLQMGLCERLVHEQHLQQQGWSAVIANLEDLSVELRHRWKVYQESFNEYIAKRDSYMDFLNQFKDDLVKLKKIPVLPALIESQKLIVPEQDDFSEDQQTVSVRSEVSLMDWISEKDNFMDCLFEDCSKGLTQTDKNEFEMLEKEIERNLEMTENITMKEIKGLGDRLFGLEKLMQDAKRYVSEQVKIAESFQRFFQNHSRTGQFKEQSVLPDLCATHFHQLNVLLENYNRLRDITRRCIKCKDELSSNLYHRLKWIVFMEDTLSEFDNKLVFSYHNLLSLQRELEILKQVHTAPATYFASIVEVVRRRKVSQSYLLWASDVACHMFTLYNDEVARRKDFQAQIDGHFLSSLFPGMDDVPPNFATQAPSMFDSGLPKLSEEDIHGLKETLPDMADYLHIPDTSAVTNYFMLKDAKEDLDKNVDKTVEDKLIEVVAEAGLSSNLDQNILKAIDNEPQEPQQTTSHGLPHLKDLDRGCESETDTEEFEKVGQSPFDLHFDKGIPSPRPGTQDASTLTEDNLQISRSEYEKLRTVLIKLAQVGRQFNSQLRSELAETKNQILQGKVLLEEACGILNTDINNTIVEKENRQREVIQRLTVDHELEISDFRKIAQSKNEEIKSLRDENATLNTELKKATEANNELQRKMEEMSDQSSKDMDDLRRRVDELMVDREKSIKDLTERLKSEHKSELESIRARFKLMTMERSPSENSLEKIERGDYSSITNHEALLLQMTENFESEKEVAVSDAISKESQKWQKILDDRVKQLENEFQQQRVFLIQDIQTRIQQDQEKQITELREQVNNLNVESIKHKTTIQQLTDYRGDSGSELMQRIDNLERDKAALRTELERYKSDTTMGASVAVCEGASTTDAATSPVKLRKRSEVSSPKAGKLNIESCKTGDMVLVVWDLAHQNFKILQESSSLYFLNADCLESLGLKVVDGQPNKLYCYAEVVEKEYCHARKDENYSVVFQPVNRFRVPQGTKFFRVKVRPPPPPKEVVLSMPAGRVYQSSASALPSSHMSQSQTTTSSHVADVIASSGPSHSLPSSPSRSNWEKSESQEATIPEEKGEDSASGPRNDEEIEKGTELTENFNVDNQSSIDRLDYCRIEEISCLPLSSQK
ncbi:RB1-inducible coiled-coil protein 1 isoform X3 [Zophobas morio]|uniref:RB1-inducible coiled-coil protein 1 isoform X3 n=1 Tax=Zophobas morio TaxID=2755281 RepID=UPI003083B312